MQKFYLLFLIVLITGVHCSAQTYTPVNLSGFDQDPFAEAGTNSITTTSGPLDATNHIMYTNTFRINAGISGGGVVDNGIIVTGSRTFQLAPFTGNNALSIKRNEIKFLTLSTPAAFTSISLLWFSTEGNSLMNLSLNFTDGTTTNYVTGYTLLDWFNGTTNIAYQNFGRIGRIAAPPYVVDGLPINPRFYYLDINLNCVDRNKVLQKVTFSNVTTAGFNAPYPNAVMLAISGSTLQQTITTSSTPANCSGTGGTASVVVTGNTGPYTYTWNTTPVQTTATATNLGAGTYTVTISDALLCSTTRQVVVTAPNPPPAPVALGGTTCVGGTVTLQIQNPVAGVIYNWFTVPSGGSIIGTGSSLIINNVNTSITYYAEAVTGSCTSTSRGAATINVLPVLSIPIVTLTSATATSLTFSWAPVPGATSYLISVDGINFVPPSSGITGTTHVINGLSSNQTVTLKVRAIGSLPCQLSPDGSGSGTTLTNEIFVPNAFTPNQDGKNDVLLVYGNTIATMNMTIFNQWGELIFETTSQTKGWDGSYKGKQQPIGVYVYVLKAVRTDGTTFNKKGSINLIR